MAPYPLAFFEGGILPKPAAGILLLTCLIAGCGQQTTTSTSSTTPEFSRSARGIVDDWSTHHVRFSSPRSEGDAIRNGTNDRWLRIVNDPRYQMQQISRNNHERFRKGPFIIQFGTRIHRDWAYPVAPANSDTGFAFFPAKYGFDINASPSCSDYIVFPVDLDGSPNQANIVGFNNLYDGTCPSSSANGFAPSVEFAYFVDVGYVAGSPVLSEDGSKIAFITEVEADLGSFHVVTLGTTGNNGTAYNSAVQPCTVNGVQFCTTNNAVDDNFSIATSSTLPINSPFIDYSSDVAYFGDGEGKLHKVTGVFRGVPSEVTTGGWPFTVEGGALSSPVYDSVSQHIFVTTGDGFLYCIDVSSGAPAFCNPNNEVGIGVSGSIVDGPTVDSTAGTVFAEGVNEIGSTYTATLTQTTTSLSNVVQASMGSGQTAISSGDFDNAYYGGNYSSGFLYFCGTDGNFTSTLYRIGFNSNGRMNNANDGNSYTFGSPNVSICTPLTETYNLSQGEDYLFLGVSGGTTPAGCNSGQACMMSFELGSSFPSRPTATLPLTGTGPLSGIVIDNVSTATGASQLYFSNFGTATQASQNGLN